MLTRLSVKTISNHSTARVVAMRPFSIVNDLYKKEKVEEDRFIKDQEAIIAEKYHQLKAAEMTENMIKNASVQDEHLKMQRAALLKAAFEDISSTLLKTGDKISKEGAKNIAYWKLGFKE